MTWSYETHFINKRKIMMCIPENYKNTEVGNPLIIAHDGEQALNIYQEYFKRNHCETNLPIIALIYTQNRLAEYTPWTAETMDSRFPYFPGEADKYLKEIDETYLPWIKERWEINDARIAMIGYSLGGLVSAYASTKYANYDKIVALCGSFWYENWISYITENNPLSAKTEFFILYGSTEGEGKTTIQKNAVENARQTVKILNLSNRVTVIESEGGHHTDFALRYMHGLNWIFNSFESY